MKVSIEHTLQVSDEQRVQIARHIDGPDAKGRDATRAEMKDFIWSHGSSWEQALVEGDSEKEADPGLVELDGMDLI